MATITKSRIIYDEDLDRELCISVTFNSVSTTYKINFEKDSKSIYFSKDQLSTVIDLLKELQYRVDSIQF